MNVWTALAFATYVLTPILALYGFFAALQKFAAFYYEAIIAQRARKDYEADFGEI